MKQYWLLLKACRHALAKGLGILLALPALYLGILLAISGIDWITGTGDSFVFAELVSPTITWVHNHPFAYTVAAALLTAAATAYGGLLDTLKALPAPVSDRQLAYLPLGVTLIAWAALLAGLLTLSPAVSPEANLSSGWTSVAVDMLYAMPLGLLIVAMINREKETWFSSPLIISSSAIIGGALLPGEWSVLQDISNLATIYPWSLPFIFAATAILLWETPGHLKRWYCAAFRHVPMGARSYAVREHAPPQRPVGFGVLARVISGAIKAIVVVAAIVFALLAIYYNFPDQTASYVQWFMALAVGITLLFGAFGIFFAGIAALATVTGQRFGDEGRPTQWIARIQYLAMRLVMPTEAKNYKALLLDESPSIWTGDSDPAAVKQRLEVITDALAKTQAQADERNEPVHVRTRLFDRDLPGNMLVLFALVSAVGFLGISVDHANEGSNIQGDTQHQPDRSYPAGGGFSQHHVALDLGKIVAQGEREETIATIQAIVEENTNPASWLEGLKTTEGKTPQVPEQYRVELSQPKAHVLVIQSLGLHWEPTGHLAYALSRRILDALGNPDTIEVLPHFTYIRPLADFERPRGFLDNGVHWIAHEEKTGDNTGSTT